MKRLALCLIALTGFGVVGPAASVQAAPQQFTVIMDNMVFGRLPTGAKVGDTIIWVNQDTVEHSATARDGSFDLRLQPGRRGRTVLRKSGNFAIYCVMHPMMRATLRVGAS